MTAPATAGPTALRAIVAASIRAQREEIVHRWLERIDASGVAEAQVFYKHEDAATGPKLAAQLLALAERP